MSRYQARQPISWIVATVDQLTRETGLARTAAVEDLVIIAYLGQLDSPDPNALNQERLLTRCRSQLLTWAWEQGHHEEIPSGGPTQLLESKRSVAAPCGALLTGSISP
jgi:hypothetical protein